jgi:hypothetical protein
MEILNLKGNIMKNQSPAILLGICLALLAGPALAGTHHCASDARTHAAALLALHRDNDERAEIDPSVKVIAPLVNPMKKTQKFDVLEVLGYIYKGSYRMRFIYAQMPDECVLIGQEILELTTL